MADMKRDAQFVIDAVDKTGKGTASAARNLRDLGNAAEGVAKKTRAQMKAEQEAAAAARMVAERAKAATRWTNDQGRASMASALAMKALAAESDRAAAASRGMASAQGRVASEVKAASRAITASKRDLGRWESGWAVNSRRMDEARTRTGKLKQAIEESRSSMKKGEKDSLFYGRGLSNLVLRSVATVGALKAIETAAKGTAAAFAAASFEQQALIGLETLTGSAEVARGLQEDIADFAMWTPFNTESLVSNARQILGVKEAVDTVIPTLTAWGDASAALGLRQDQFDRAMLARTQSMAKEKIMAEELMQITEAGIPIYSLLADATGLSAREIRKLGEAGMLVSQEIMPMLQKQMEKVYGGSMERQSKTLGGLWSNLQDTFKLESADAIQSLIPVIEKYAPKAMHVMGASLEWLGGKIEASVEWMSRMKGEYSDWLAVNPETVESLKRTGKILGETLKDLFNPEKWFGEDYTMEDLFKIIETWAAHIEMVAHEIQIIQRAVQGVTSALIEPFSMLSDHFGSPQGAMRRLSGETYEEWTARQKRPDGKPIEDSLSARKREVEFLHEQEKTLSNINKLDKAIRARAFGGPDDLFGSATMQATYNLPAGRDITKGGSVTKGFKDIANGIKKLFSRDSAKSEESFADRMREKMRRLKAEADEAKRELADVNERLSKAESKVTDLKGKYENLRDSIISAFSGISLVTRLTDSVGKDTENSIDGAKRKLEELKSSYDDLVKRIEDANKGEGITGRGVTAGVILNSMQRDLLMAQEFQRTLKALQARGLNSSILEDLASQGFTNARASANALLSGGKAAIEAANRLQGQLGTTASDTAKFIADVVYGKKLEVAEARIAKLSLSGISTDLAGGNFDEIVSSMKRDARTAEDVDSGLRRLRKMGLSDSLLEDLASQGLGSADTIAALLSGGKKGVAQVNKLQARLEGVGKSLGKTIAGDIYSDKIRAAEAEVKKLKVEQIEVKERSRKASSAAGAASFSSGPTWTFAPGVSTSTIPALEVRGGDTNVRTVVQIDGRTIRSTARTEVNGVISEQRWRERVGRRY